MIDPQAEARDKMALLQRAKDYRELISTRGWILLRRLQDQMLLSHMEAMKKAHQPDAALDALRRWQIAEELVDLQSAEIDQTIKLADEIRGTLGMEEALLMMEFKNEFSSTGDPGAADSTSN